MKLKWVLVSLNFFLDKIFEFLDDFSFIILGKLLAFVLHFKFALRVVMRRFCLNYHLYSHNERIYERMIDEVQVFHYVTLDHEVQVFMICELLLWNLDVV